MLAICFEGTLEQENEDNSEMAVGVMGELLSARIGAFYLSVLSQ